MLPAERTSVGDVSQSIQVSAIDIACKYTAFCARVDSLFPGTKVTARLIGLLHRRVHALYCRVLYGMALADPTLVAKANGEELTRLFAVWG